MGKLLSIHIDRDLAREIIRDLFGDEDEAQLLEAALDRRLRGKPERLNDPGERRKILAYLVRQGFSASAASAPCERRQSANRSSSRRVPSCLRVFVSSCLRGLKYVHR
jgi:SOS response regulatory protein OraA/RecX